MGPNRAQEIKMTFYRTARDKSKAQEEFPMNKRFNTTAIRSVLFTACASLAIALPAAADSINVLPTVIQVDVNGVGASDFGTYAGSGSTITLTSTPNPRITSDTTGLGPDDTANEYFAEAYIDYYVGITGGQYGDLVPLLVSGSLSSSASAPDGGDVSYGQASLSITFDGGNYGASENVFCGNVSRGEDCSNPSWSGTLSALAGVGYNNVVAISAMTVVESSGIAHAFADPYITIDPTFLASHPGYALVLTEGNTASATPEPSTLLLAFGCLLGLFIARRKRPSQKEART
jgi:hypothetical protein